MFKFLRKYNKWILAFGGTVLMIAFLVPEAISRLSQQAAQGGAGWATVDNLPDLEAIERIHPRTWLVYTTDEAVMDTAIEHAVDGGVSIAFNLTGGLFVNQSAAFSDFHVTGHNPAGNASLTDPAFVAGRFKVIGVRREV